MITGLMNWLDHRAGIRKWVALMLLEGVPGGARWRYVWGSCLAFVFSLQLITGILLMTAYSPSSSQAWSSVHFIQYQMDFGWLIRGLHHFGSQTMVVLIALHMLQVVIAGAHLPPREVNWWLGIGLLSCTLGLSLTGYLLPWDQKGYWATRVATNIASNIPVFGDDIKQLAVGGPDYGNHTLTRFYALHVAILPLSLIVLLVAHITIFRRHGVTSSVNQEGLVTRPENEDAEGSEEFWPRQAFYDMVACMVIFAIMLSLVLYGFGNEVEVPPREDGTKPAIHEYEYWAKAGQRGKGADLDAAADRDTPNYPARPEWYFLFLFQLLKYFPGDQILIGTVFIPNGVMLLLTLLPLFGYGPMRKVGHFFGVLVMMTLLVCVAGLTVLALRDDQHPVLMGLAKLDDEKAMEKAHHFRESVDEAEKLAKRACQLAMAGTPVEGGHFLLRNDPLTKGQKLFQEKCGSCHSFSKRDGDIFDEGWHPKNAKGKDSASASDLGEFGTREWVRSLLKDPMDAKHFGLVKKKDAKGMPLDEPGLTGMRGWHKGIMEKRQEWDAAKIEKQEKDFDLIAAWVADQRKPRDKRDSAIDFKAAQDAFFDKKNRCSGCHSIEVKEEVAKGQVKFTVEGGGDEGVPDLTNYGSAEWIRAMIMRPGHKSRYGSKNLMPAFRNTDGPGSELYLEEFREGNPPPEGQKENSIQHLSDVDREMIIRWMLRDYRPIFGGAGIPK